MAEWEEAPMDLDQYPDDDDAIEFKASAEGVILPLECAECGGLFFGYWDETICPTCLEGNDVLNRLMAGTESVASAEAEEEFFAYRCIEYTKGWLHTKIELNVNLPAPTWLDELHAIMTKRGCLRQDGKGGWRYDYPEDLGDYMRLLTIVAAAHMRPFDQMCVIVKFWRTRYMYVNLMVIEDGKLKSIQHCGPWSKWMKLGKEEELVEFKPFHPVTFQYNQPTNKGFRQLIDVWRNTKEGGVDELIRRAAEEVFGTNNK